MNCDKGEKKDARGRCRVIRGLRLPRVWDIGWFWSFVDIPSAEACWTWTGARAAVGYGVFARFGYAHRISLEVHLGRKLRKGEESCHTCDNRLCVNPAHLFAGSRSDNMRDMVRKGRKPGQILTCATVREARARRLSGESVTGIAKSMGCSRVSLSHALNGYSWRHVT